MGRLVLRGDRPVTVPTSGKGVAVRQPEAVAYPVHLGFHRPLATPEFFGDLGVGSTLVDEAEDPFLRGRQRQHPGNVSRGRDV